MNDEAEAVFQDIIDRGMEPTEACATEIIRLRVQVRLIIAIIVGALLNGLLSVHFHVLAGVSKRSYLRIFCREYFFHNYQEEEKQGYFRHIYITF